MRSREEIERSACDQGLFTKGDFTLLEVLLDIRDLLEKKGCGGRKK